MEGRWCTPSDVVADVSRAGGRLPPAPLADACLAWGERPAPIVLTEPELVAAPAATPEHAAPPPDLRGITRMLRMVQAEDSDQYSSATGDIVISKLDRTPVPSYHRKGARTQLTNIYYKDANANDDTADNIMTSDLNPNVAEFVPSSLPPAVPRGPSDRIVGNVDSVSCQAEGRTSGQEREELAARLRDDIRGGHDKYTAIARLMRLYAQPAPAPASCLLTPDYFEREAAAPERAADGNQKGNSSHLTETALERMELVGSHCGSPMIRERQPEAEPKRGADLHDVRASVEKVQRWLDGEDASPRPPTRISPRVLAGPVTFRSRTPASFARTPPPPLPSAPVVRAYSPPRAAVALLHREYAARAAAAKAADPLPAATETLWMRLEARLREKDAELRARGAAVDT